MSELEELRKNEQMRSMIDKIMLDYDRIKEQYKSGYGLDKIAEMHRITVEQLKWILNNVIRVTNADGKIRKENREKFRSIQISFELPENRKPIYPNQGIPKVEEEEEYEL